MSELIIRAFELKEFKEETREITGLAVPYGKATNGERFEPGAIASVDNVKLCYGHVDPIGKVISGRDTDEGYEITARISETPRGNEIYTLLKDDVLNRFSVGFKEVVDGQRLDKDGTVVRTKIDLREVSVVAIPWYDDAKVSEVRAESNNATNKTKEVSQEDTNNMTEENVYDDSELRSELDIVKRELAVVRENGVVNNSTEAQYRSGGEFLKGLAAGEQEARAFATSADAGVGTTWVGGAQRLLDENRTTVELFNKAPLPASGNVIEFAAMPVGTGTVDRQVNEGDVLPYMEVVVATGTATVQTYGGYSSISRQAIERSDVSYLDTVLRYQTLQYAQATNKVVRDALVANAVAGGTLGADSGAEWIELVSNTVDSISGATGYNTDFVVVSSDVFLRLATIVDTTGRPLFAVNGDGQNTFGNVSLPGRTANIAGIPVVVDSGLVAGSAFAAARDAITVFESAGAPFRLTDEDIIRLTKDFSLYGYMAVGATAPAAAVRLDVDLVA